MAKSSGNTRQSSVGAKVKAGVILNVHKRTYYNRFQSYDSSRWEKTAYFKETGGYLVTSLARIAFSEKNNVEKSKFEKEQQMCRRYASWGFQIEHLDEISGVSSNDANIRKHGMGSVIKVDGRKAELKSLSSANNINNEGKKAVRKQGAELVMFEFTKHDANIKRRLMELASRNIHGYYYYKDEDTYNSF